MIQSGAFHKQFQLELGRGVWKLRRGAEGRRGIQRFEDICVEVFGNYTSTKILFDL